MLLLNLTSNRFRSKDAVIINIGSALASERTLHIIIQVWFIIELAVQRFVQNGWTGGFS